MIGAANTDDSCSRGNVKTGFVQFPDQSCNGAESTGEQREETSFAAILCAVEFEGIELELCVRAHGDKSAIQHFDLCTGVCCRSQRIAFPDYIALFQYALLSVRTADPDVTVNKLGVPGVYCVASLAHQHQAGRQASIDNCNYFLNDFHDLPRI